MRIEYLIVVGAYLLGSVPFAYLIVRATTGRDVRTVGSGNVGATNAMRAAGWWAAAAVMIFDIAKGVVPVLIMRHYNPAGAWLGTAAVAAVVGHCYPVWLRFRGGKGMATACGAFVTLSPIAAAGAALVWLVVLGIRRVVSLASLLACASFPMWLAWAQRAGAGLVVTGALVAVIIIVRHTGNIKRLIAGIEPRIGQKHPNDEEDR